MQQNNSGISVIQRIKNKTSGKNYSQIGPESIVFQRANNGKCKKTCCKHFDNIHRVANIHGCIKIARFYFNPLTTMSTNFLSMLNIPAIHAACKNVSPAAMRTLCMNYCVKFGSFFRHTSSDLCDLISYPDEHFFYDTFYTILYQQQWQEYMGLPKDK